LIPLPEYSFRNKEAHEEKLELFKEIGLMWYKYKLTVDNYIKIVYYNISKKN
jgi:hypothetical protein